MWSSTDTLPASGTTNSTPSVGATNQQPSSGRRNRNKSRSNKGSASAGTTGKKYQGDIDGLATIGLKNDSYQTDNFLIFQRGIVQYVLNNFDNPGDIVYLPRELSDPVPRFMKDLPSIRKLKIDAGIDPDVAVHTLTRDEQDMIAEFSSLLDTERKSFVFQSFMD